jgi:hypothetical protein
VFCYVAQAGLEFLGSRDPSQEAGTTACISVPGLESSSK